MAASAPARMLTAPSAEERYKMIQEAAYFLAEKNGFAGNPADYWGAAEQQINMLISGKST